MLLAGAFAVAVGTWGTIRTSSIKEKFADDRIAANEAETKRAIADSDIARQGAADANARAAEANRVAEGEKLARLKLEKELAWRSLSDEAHAQFVASAKPFAGQVFDLITYQDDPEAKNFANIIGGALLEAGWKLDPPNGFLAFQIEIGVRFEIAPSMEKQLAPAVNALTEACGATGVAASAGLREGLEKDKPNIIRVRVGKKPERAAR